MKPNHLFVSLLGLTSLLVTSCSTSKLAQNTVIEDDVYNSTAQAKVYKPAENVQQTAINNDNDYRQSDPYYDMDYSSRIDRFYYGNPSRSYFDPYYNFYGYNNFYGFNNFYNPFGYYYGGLSGYYNNWYNNPFYAWGYYGMPYYNNFWGPYSYGGFLGGGIGGGGLWNGGYYGAGVIVGRNTRNPNYGPRPTRGSENGIARANGSSYYGGNNASTRANANTNGTNPTVTRTRAEMYNPTGNTSSSRPSPTSSSGGNTRTSSSEARPTRSNDAPSRPQPTYSPPVQQSAPPASSSGGSRSEGSSSSGGGRPTRGGGK